MENQDNIPTRDQLKRRRNAEAQRRYRQKWPERVKEQIKKSKALKRENFNKRVCKWRDLAALPEGCYQAADKHEREALRRAIIERGFYCQTKKTNQGFKVYKLKVAHE